MSQQVREHLSALMDGELSREETMFLLRHVAHDRSLAPCWSNFHVARQILRRQDLLVIDGSFAEAVLARIELESNPKAGRSGPWVRWISGGAIAASVAVVALMFSGQRTGQDLPAGQALSAGSGQPAVMATSKQPEFRPPMISPALDVQPASAATAGFATPSTPIDPRLQSYLIRHYDAAGSSGQSGLMPYVLLIVPSQQSASDTKAELPVEQR